MPSSPAPLGAPGGNASEDGGAGDAPRPMSGAPNPDASAQGRRRRSSPWGRILTAVLLLAGLTAFIVFGGHRYLSLETLSDNREALLRWRDQNAGLAALAFIGVYAAVVAASLPGGVWLTIAGGFLFGAIAGTACTVVGATIGACAVFLAARYVAGDALRRRVGGAIGRMEAGFRENALNYLLVLRLVPLFPFWLVNLVPAFLGVPFRTYLIATLIGIIPGSFVFALAGDGLGAVLDAGGHPDLGIIFEPRVIAPIIGLAVLSLLPVVYKRVRRPPANGKESGR